MEDVLFRILGIFRSKGIRAGQVLVKKEMMDEIKTWSTQDKMLVRDAWHTLVGQGLIQDGHPDGPTLTVAGERIAYAPADRS